MAPARGDMAGGDRDDLEIEPRGAYDWRHHVKRGTRMSRFAVRVLIVAALIGVGWAVGRAQSVPSDFELMVSAAAGETSITCVRGCSLTWAPVNPPKDGPVEIHVPAATLRGYLNSNAAQSCLAASWSPQNCKIWGWVKR